MMIVVAQAEARCSRWLVAVGESTKAAPKSVVCRETNWSHSVTSGNIRDLFTVVGPTQKTHYPTRKDETTWKHHSSPRC